MDDGIYEYNTDGLIFTPSNLAVGASLPDRPAGPLFKTTWDQSFKWKPVEFNTIDFLVSLKKDEKTGKDAVYNIFTDGRNMQGTQEVVQYKTVILNCGFDERVHGFMNPCQEVLNDHVPTFGDMDNDERYKPVPFQPTDPYDEKAYLCNIRLKENGSLVSMLTEEGEYFEEDMIVEFKYVESNEEGWRWIPLRVRYDKTSDLRAGGKNYGNAYHVANNNWHSIHHPITRDMICRGENIPELAPSEDVYYNRAKIETSTQGLRDFHNLYVKKKLIVGVSHRHDTLIDYAVGKAGDLSKWIQANLSFIFGVDISKDNIHNQKDGACSRYLSTHRKYKIMPKALFVVGNSGFNIRKGLAFTTEKDKQITNAVFGQGPKDKAVLGQGVYNQYGKAEKGFNVSSCQFAMHYFFENKTLFHSFLRNISECTKMQGYFIGTCYDGAEVFRLLKNKKRDEGITILKGERKIYEIIKLYDETGFPDDEMSLGYAVNVYQESINKVFREYLVNFNYLIRIMEDYGFVLVSKEEAHKMDLPDGSGLFSELFTHLEIEMKKNPLKQDYGTAPNMTIEEKQISFMNRYFIFKKVRNVDAEKMGKIILNKDLAEDEAPGIVEELGKEQEKEAEKPVEPEIKKVKKPRVVIRRGSGEP